MSNEQPIIIVKAIECNNEIERTEQPTNLLYFSIV